MPLVQNWVDGVDVKPGQAVMLENCRVNKGEKSDDEASREDRGAVRRLRERRLGTAHRAEATTHGVARFAKVACAGPLMAAARRARQGARQPGAAARRDRGRLEVSTKLTVLAELANKVDSLIVGGGIANTFLLAAGKPIGKSLAEPDLAGEAKRIMKKTRVPLPSDVVVERRAKPVEAVGRTR